MIDFDITIAQSLVDSQEQFPVDFEKAWVWLGYSKKDKALKTLKSYFTEDEDFALPREGEWSQSGRSSDYYRLTNTCFREMGMLAKTSQGKEIRKYFIDCEKIAKSIAQSQPIPQPILLPTTEQLAGLIKESNQKLLALYKARTVTYKKDKDGAVKMTVYKNRVKEYETYISDKSKPSLVNPQILIIGHYDDRVDSCNIDIDSPLKEAYVRWRDYDHVYDRKWTRAELEEWVRVNFPIK